MNGKRSIRLISFVFFIFVLFAGLYRMAYADTNEELVKAISGQTYFANGYTVEFWPHDQNGFVDVTTHGDIKLINTIYYEIWKGVILIEGDIAIYQKEGGVTVDHLFLQFVVSHDGILFPVPRDNLQFQKR